jgi:DNA-binding CsgD family transcriptional regulator
LAPDRPVRRGFPISPRGRPGSGDAGGRGRRRYGGLCRIRFQVNFALLDDTELAIVGIYRRVHDFRREELRALEHARTPISAALAYRHAVARLERRLPDRPRRTVALTLREEQVLRLVAAGSTNRQVGRRLDVTERTVRKHLEDIYRRLDVTNRVAASRWWIESTSRRP